MGLLTFSINVTLDGCVDHEEGVLLGSTTLATELDRLELIDEYRFLVHPRIAGHGPTLYQTGLPGTRRLELVSSKPLRNGAVAMHYRRARRPGSHVAPGHGPRGA
ncbi:MAG: dihydrofolate reductase family protein [Gaiellales bacterium]